MFCVALISTNSQLQPCKQLCSNVSALAGSRQKAQKALQAGSNTMIKATRNADLYGFLQKEAWQQLQICLASPQNRLLPYKPTNKPTNQPTNQPTATKALAQMQICMDFCTKKGSGTAGLLGLTSKHASVLQTHQPTNQPANQPTNQPTSSSSICSSSSCTIPGILCSS